MNFEQFLDSGPLLFGGSSHPRQTTQKTTPWDPEMARSMAAKNAQVETLRLQREAESNTPKGRKKAADTKLAENRRKESDWLSRVIYDRGNGWKPIWGTAEDEELRIYTLLDSDEHRFWGIKPIGMGIDDFWEIHDPEVRRYDDRQQETPVNPDEPVGPLIGEPLRSLPPAKTVTKPRQRQKTPEVNSTYKIRKSTPKSQKITSTRKSLTHKVDAGNLDLENQMQQVPMTSHSGGRTTRAKVASTASSSQQKKGTEIEGSSRTKDPRPHLNANTKVAEKKTTVTSKRPRGRPPAKEKLTERPPKQKKTPAVKENARVTKPSQKKPRPLAPSTHQMRTRRAGPAELLSLP